MQRSVETFAAIQLMVVGLSHMAQRHAWVEFFELLRAHGRPGVVLHGLISLGFGSLILAFQSERSGPGFVLFLTGWAYCAKGVACLVFPATQRLTLRRVSTNRAYEIALAGAVLFSIGVIAALSAYASFGNRV